VRDIETLDAELRLVAALRVRPGERGGPLPPIEVADALLDERRELIGLPRLTSCLGKHYMGSPQQSKGRDRHSDRWADCR
jgi:hypothetical protein